MYKDSHPTSSLPRCPIIINTTYQKGAEYEVLKMLPWDKVDIEVLMVELEHVGKVGKTVRMMKMLEYWSNVDGHDDDEDGFL